MSKTKVSFESDLVKRIFSKIDKRKQHWVWKGAHTVNGYGYIGFLAHRLVYEILEGEIPLGLVIDHTCRKRDCVNPAHMRVVTLEENNRVGNSPPAQNARKKRCKRGHLFSPDNIFFHKKKRIDGRLHVGRVCKKCIHAEQKRYRDRKKNVRLSK